jgi:hypothetical protein
MTIRPIEERDRPSVKLAGEDGNAFAIMGRVRTALKVAEWTKEEITEFMDSMMESDYNHLLIVVCDACEVDSYDE